MTVEQLHARFQQAAMSLAQADHVAVFHNRRNEIIGKKVRVWGRYRKLPVWGVKPSKGGKVAA